jgi:hypothetical protein
MLRCGVAAFLDSQAVMEEAHSAGVELQITDLELAHSFMDRADTSLNPVTINRNLLRAREAYVSILNFLAQLNPTDEQQARLDALLPLLKARLDAAFTASNASE